MNEHVRSIRVRIDVDTNKETFVLDAPRSSFNDTRVLVDQFLAMLEDGGL